MPKRKRENNAEEELARGRKLLIRTLKLVKGFERQKLGRRHKAAEADNNLPLSARVGLEIQALKVSALPISDLSTLAKCL